MIKKFIIKHLTPVQIVVASFAGVIFIGTILLSLPFATQSGERLSPINAFFTATSATCVTGLAVVDTGTTFSVFGQLVILACIQTGGLGLMAYTTIFLVATGRRMAIADRIAIQESFTHAPTGEIKTLVKYIVIATFLTEAVVGLGHFGANAARVLYEAGKTVIAIDCDEEAVQGAAEFSTQAVFADATDRQALVSLGVPDVDAPRLSV